MVVCNFLVIKVRGQNECIDCNAPLLYRRARKFIS